MTYMVPILQTIFALAASPCLLSAQQPTSQGAGAGTGTLDSKAKKASVSGLVCGRAGQLNSCRPRLPASVWRKERRRISYDE